MLRWVQLHLAAVAVVIGHTFPLLLVEVAFKAPAAQELVGSGRVVGAVKGAALRSGGHCLGGVCDMP